MLDLQMLEDDLVAVRQEDRTLDTDVFHRLRSNLFFISKHTFVNVYPHNLQWIYHDQWACVLQVAYTSQTNIY